MAVVQKDDSLGFLLGDVWRAMRRSFAQGIEGSTLTQAQARALVHVSRHPGLRQVELAELLEVKPITLARLIDSLVAAKLVERRADTRDRRAYRIYLRAAAQAHLRAIAEVGGLIRQQALRDFSTEEVVQVVFLLKKMRENLAKAAR